VLRFRRRCVSSLPLAAPGLGVPAGLGLCLGVATLTSGEAPGPVFFAGGGPESD